METVESKVEDIGSNKEPLSKINNIPESEILFKAPLVKIPINRQKSTANGISEMLPRVDTSKCYKPPEWAQTCPSESNYFIEVIKNGIPLPDDTIHLTGVNHCILGRQPAPLLNPYLVDGRMSPLLHPSISRAHAVLQYGCNADSTPGWYLFDFDSTHGTYVNKHRVPPGRYIRLRVGYVLRLGSSTRLLILNGPEDDVEEETKESFSELVAKKKKKIEKLAKMERNEQDLKELTEESVTGIVSSVGPCNWGISDDAEEEDNGEIMRRRLAESGNCLSHEKNYVEDPKKALKAFFDREGLDSEYEFVEGKFGQQICRIELPLEEGTVYAEAPLTGRKKKEAITACALEACRMLDRLGQFDTNRGAEAVRRAREKAYWEENDYYSSDEDNFLDRTGQVEIRRRQRMRRLGVDNVPLKPDNSISMKTDEEQHDSFTLLAKLEELGKEIIRVEDELNAAERALEATGENTGEMDELEAYMEAIKNGAPKRAERQALKRRLIALRQEEVRLLRRVGIRNTPVRFLSSTSFPSTASAAIRATLANALIDKVDTNKQESGYVESKLNALKRQLPRVAVHTTFEQKKNIDGEEEAFVPEVDEDEEDLTDGAKQGSGQSGEETSENKPTQERLSESDLETNEKRAKYEENSVVSTKARYVGNSASLKIVEPANKIGISSKKSPKQQSLSNGEEEQKQSKRPVLGPSPASTPIVVQPTSHNEPASMGMYDENVDDPNFALWLPPPGQTGDGITQLNKKYGY